jgi:hypothetical protein
MQMMDAKPPENEALQKKICSKILYLQKNNRLKGCELPKIVLLLQAEK